MSDNPTAYTPDLHAPDATDVMCDLETLGTAPYAPILSIGACAFRAYDDTPITDMFYQAITLESCLELGLRPSAGTIKWWMQREKDAQAVFHDSEAVALPLALDAFTDWLNSRPMDIWGNSVRFDCGLLEPAYKVCNKLVPWEFWRERCYRTMKTLPGARDIPLVRTGTYHNALDDAVTQAVHLRKILRHLYPTTTPTA